MPDPRSASILTSPPTPPSTTLPGYGPSTRRPANPPLGFLYYDTTLQLEIVWTGQWRIVGVSAVPLIGFGTTAQRPTAPTPGFIFFDSTLQQSLTWNGTGWVSNTAGSTVAMVGAGTTGERPSSPPPGFLYFDTTLQQQLVWNGGSWINLGPAAPLPPAIPAITSATTASGQQGTAFSYHITATNTPSSYNVSGLLPTGVTVNTSTGLISGTPSVNGTFIVNVTATNGSGTGGTNLTITIVPPAAPTPGRFTEVAGIGAINTDFPMVLGFTVATNDASTISLSITSADGGQFPPGIFYTVVDPNSNVLASGNTAGGESNISLPLSIALSGGYTVVLSTAGAIGTFLIDATISGAKFKNGALRCLTFGPVVIPPSGLGAALFIRGIDPTTLLAVAQFTEAETNVLRQAPDWSWSFNGDTINNPKTNWSTGITQIELDGFATGSAVTASRIEVSGG